MSKTRGAQRERAVADLLRSRGWFVVRAAGSHGPADLVALRAGDEARLIQVKSSPGGLFAGFGPKDRNELRNAARAAGARAVLVWWPPYKSLVWAQESEWPD